LIRSSDRFFIGITTSFSHQADNEFVSIIPICLGNVGKAHEGLVPFQFLFLSFVFAAGYYLFKFKLIIFVLVTFVKDYIDLFGQIYLWLFALLELTRDEFPVTISVKFFFTRKYLVKHFFGNRLTRVNGQ
jgi:hypothetical protein